jgi:choline dehydrogenase-like flavoprotein
MQYPSLNWGYQTVPQRHVNNRQLDYTRGKGLGGSTQINLCCYTVGPKDDYDRWAAEVGDDDFNWENNVRRRKKIESYDSDISDAMRNYADPDMSLYGTDGPVRVEFGKEPIAPLKTFIEAGRQSSLGASLDINGGNPLGMTALPATGRAGERSTAAGAYLSSRTFGLWRVRMSLLMTVDSACELDD